MAQNNPDSRNKTIRIFMLLYLAGLFFLAPRLFGPQPAPEQQRSVIEAARTLEADGRKVDNNVTEADRVKKLEQAVNKYEEFYQKNQGSPEGHQARFNEINIYDYLANLQKKSGSHWYDQAEQRLKDMEKKFHGVTGSVEVERAGVRTRTPELPLSQVASERLNELRASRDALNSNKPTYIILDTLVKLTGKQPSYSYFFALLLVVVVLKAITFPFQKKQYKYSQDMMRVQPLIKEAQEKYKDRPPQELNQRIFQIYKEENVNLASGCLPMLVLMFVLLPVFWMVRAYEYQFTHATFLWIGSEYSKQVWWLADNLAQFDVPMFFLYLASTMLSFVLQPKPVDPQQAQTQKMMLYIMPVMFGYMMWVGQWSSAFMLYWLILSIVSAYQSWALMKQFGLNKPSSARVGSPGSGGTDGGVITIEAPAPSLQPMKGVHTPKQNNGGSNGRRGSTEPVARIRMRGPRKR